MTILLPSTRLDRADTVMVVQSHTGPYFQCFNFVGPERSVVLVKLVPV